MDYLKPDTFRFGASGVYADLKMTLDTKGQVKQEAKVKSSRRKREHVAGY
jgi:hypothetical protein